MYLYGASGHAKVVIEILQSNGVKVEALIDDNPNISELSGIPVLHDAKDYTPFIITIGNCKIRKLISQKLDCIFAKAIHPSAIVSPSAIIDDGCVVMHGAIIQADASIGKHCIINTKASIDHECKIGDFVHIAPGVTLSGNVEVGECSWIGVGTCIKQGIKIGKNCMIGAGSVVVKDIPDNCIAYGNPCRVVSKND